MIYTHIFDEEVESALKSFRQAPAVAVYKRTRSKGEVKESSTYLETVSRGRIHAPALSR